MVSKRTRQEVWTWAEYLTEKGDIDAVPVSNFRHVPFGPVWDELVRKNMKVEVPTKLCHGFRDRKFENPFWVAEVKGFAGYMLKLKFLSLGEPPKEAKQFEEFWVHWNECYPVGYCRSKGIELVPPQGDTLRGLIVDGRRKDLQNLLHSALVTSFTKHEIIPALLEHALTSMYKPGDKVEMQNDQLLSEMKLGTVIQTCGRRVLVQYFDHKPDSNSVTTTGVEPSLGFWWHEKSEQVRPDGWCREVGHRCTGPKNHKSPVITNKSLISPPVPSGIRIEKGMKLEAIDPICPSDICAATVTKVLRNGYFMIKIDSVETNEGEIDSTNEDEDSFCVHITSPSIFKCGFCKKHDIQLKPPVDFKGTPEDFDWKEYLASTENKKGILNIKHEEIDHDFKVGSKLEVVDLVQSSFVCPATVIEVAGRLIRIRFDGWDDQFDQYHDVTSNDLFPVGWCELVGHPLTPPKQQMQELQLLTQSKTSPPKKSSPPKKKSDCLVNAPPPKKKRKA